MPYQVALTGGISSGKTTVSNRFLKLGVPVIDADLISKQLVERNSPLLQKIVSTFGLEYLKADGNLDRAKLRTLIFSQPEARATLEGILHPAIAEEMQRQAKDFDQPYVLLAIPLLAETGAANRFDRVLLVDADEQTQIRRLMTRDKISEEDARRMLAAQASRAQRLALADDVLHNDADLDTLYQQIDTLHNKYLRLAQASTGI